MIDGVIIKKLKKYEDDRGWVTELYRSDEESFDLQMSYASYTKFNVVRGPHEHIKQSDYFCFSGPGDFEMHLWDNRKDSPTYKEYVKMVVGESNPAVTIIPPGVVHGYKSISENGSWYVNTPNALYAGKDKQEEVDEIRHETDESSEFKIL